MQRFVSALTALMLLALTSSTLAEDAPRLSPIHTDSGIQRTMSERMLSLTYPDAMPGYHNGAQVVCSDCHITHASQSHEYVEGSPGYNETVPYTGGANVKLLKAADSVDLCLSCHDGQTFAPDVMSADVNGLTERSAGHFEAPEEYNPRGHDLGRSLPSGGNLCSRCHWGTGTEVKVTCIDCHNPHGNYVARNLQWASYPVGTPDFGLFTNPAATGMAKYEEANVSYGTLNTSELREVTNMCIDCHHVFTGAHYIDPDEDGNHIKHPSYESERNHPNFIDQGAATGGSDPAHWDAGTGSGFGTTPRVRFMASGATTYDLGLVVDSENNGVFCLSCHKAHGSDQAFSMTWQLAGGYSAPGCDQCHAIAKVDSP